ncbi:MAG: peptidoglycan-binding protein [Rhodospirillales bacterium]|nr:peptidoglycan-binding protein [Rhodospirillales bacterium]
MKTSMIPRLIAIAAVVLAAGVTGGTPVPVFAQAPAPTAPSGLSSATIKALQEALNKQGIAVKTDGVLDGATREAVRKYQSQHHLPVTGEPDKATLDKLGVAIQPGAAAPGGGGMTGQGMMQPGMMPPGHMGGGMMGGGSMPQGQGTMGQGMGQGMGPGSGMGPGQGMGQGSGAAPMPGMPKQ